MDIRQFCAMVSKLDMNFKGHWFEKIAENAKVAHQLYLKTRRESHAVLGGCWSIIVLGLLSSTFDIAAGSNFISRSVTLGGFCLLATTFGVAMCLAVVRRNKIARLKVGEQTLNEVLTKLEALSLSVGEPVEKMITMSSKDIIAMVKQNMANHARAIRCCERLQRDDAGRSRGDVIAIAVLQDKIANVKGEDLNRIIAGFDPLVSCGICSQAEMQQAKREMFKEIGEKLPELSP